MGRFLIRRLLLAIVVLFGVTSLTYLMMTAAAGNYVPGLDLQGQIRPEDIDRLRVSLGLDRPVHIQYLSWMSGILQGDFGRSMIDGSTVVSNLGQRLPNTLLLSLTSLVIGVFGGVVMGVASALNRGRFLDRAFSVVAVAGFAIPQFWLGLILILIFAVGFRSWGLPALPSSGAFDPVSGGGFADRVLHLILPAATLSFVYLSVWSRYVRSSMITALSEDYVRTARSKGLREVRVVFGHAFRNAVMPLVTLIGLEFPRLVSGSLVVEVIYGWPGVGRFAYERALAYDYTSVMGVTAFVAVMVVFGSLVADIGYGMADPRIKYE